jgi:hypothetical protein
MKHAHTSNWNKCNSIVENQHKQTDEMNVKEWIFINNETYTIWIDQNNQSTHRFWHSSIVSKRLSFPPQPPYDICSHCDVFKLYQYLVNAPSHGPVSLASAHTLSFIQYGRSSCIMHATAVGTHSTLAHVSYKKEVNLTFNAYICFICYYTWGGS